jgi:hypothetical protein
VFISRRRDTDPSKPPQFSFDKKDRRVTVYYFYLWLRHEVARCEWLRVGGRLMPET